MMPDETRGAAWLIRPLLAALLLFGSEILLWTNPPGRTPVDWLLLAAGYLVLSMALLDLMVRFRVRDVAGLLLLAGLYGLAASLIINPETMLSAIPRTIITRVLGAHTFAALLMLAAFLTLLRPRGQAPGRLLLVGSVPAGVGWGVWARHIATTADVASGEAAAGVVLGYGAVGLALIVILLVVTARGARGLTPAALLLGAEEWAALGVMAAALVLVRSGQHALEAPAPGIVLSLIVFCGVMVWFQKAERGAMLPDARLPAAALPVLWPVLAGFTFIAGGAVGYALPPTAGALNLSGLLAGWFAIFGFVWLPLVSVVLGLRAARLQTRTGRL